MLAEELKVTEAELVDVVGVPVVGPVAVPADASLLSMSDGGRPGGGGGVARDVARSSWVRATVFGAVMFEC